MVLFLFHNKIFSSPLRFAPCATLPLRGERVAHSGPMRHNAPNMRHCESNVSGHFLQMRQSMRHLCATLKSGALCPNAPLEMAHSRTYTASLSSSSALWTPTGDSFKLRFPANTKPSLRKSLSLRWTVRLARPHAVASSARSLGLSL